MTYFLRLKLCNLIKNIDTKRKHENYKTINHTNYFGTTLMSMLEMLLKKFKVKFFAFKKIK